ncbi:hypothetical protein ES703_106347 [subsurface metagenome]
MVVIPLVEVIGMNHQQPSVGVHLVEDLKCLDLYLLWDSKVEVVRTDGSPYVWMIGLLAFKQVDLPLHGKVLRLSFVSLQVLHGDLYFSLDNHAVPGDRQNIRGSPVMLDGDNGAVPVEPPVAHHVYL